MDSFTLKSRLVAWGALGLVCASPAAAMDECRELRVKVDLTQRQLEDFTQQQAELNEKFKQYVEKDFDNQSEGVLDDLARSSAIKVVYARKRLKQAIEGKTMALLSTKNEYCTKCATNVDPMEREVFCKRCPSMPMCQTAKK